MPSSWPCWSTPSRSRCVVPALAALALAGLWSVPLVFERPPTSAVVLAGGGTLVLLLWAVRPSGPPAPTARETARAVGVAATVAVLALVLTPLAASAPGWAGTSLPARWGSVPSSGLLSLSTDLDLRADLGNRPDRTVMTYRTDLADLGPLRTSTLVRFTGTRWESSPSGRLQPTTDVLWPEQTDAVPSVPVAIQVTDLDQTTLPIPLDPRTVEAGAQWAYDQVNDVVRGRGARSAGLAYSVLVAPRDLSAESLRADQVHEIGPSAWELEVLSPFADRIADLAGTVVGEAETPYDQAVALQTWFRDVRLFTYSTDVAPARTDDAVWDFLQDRRGYCVQFATSMAIMARTLGIPARVGVGFLPGERGTDGVWRVSARKAHAWPELWFAESGWVRFEPTPAVQTLAAPAYTNPDLGTPAAPTDDVPTTTATPRPTVSAAPVTPTAGGTVQSSGGSIAPLVAGGIALAVLGLAAVLVRRRRPPTTPERAWSQVRAAAAGSVGWSSSTTPRQAEALLLANWGSETGSAEAASALRRLVSCVQDDRYAPRPPEWDAAELDACVVTVLAEISRAGRAASPSGLRGA